MSLDTWKRATMARVTAALRGERPITVAGVAVAQADEIQHFKIVGISHDSKLAATREILTAALARGDQALIVDPHGILADDHYDPSRGDAILSGGHQDATRWNIFRDLQGRETTDALARGLIPNTQNPYLSSSVAPARQLFSDVAQRQSELVHEADRGRHLFRLLELTDQRLKRLVQGTRSEALFSPDNAHTLSRVRLTLVPALSTLERVEDRQGFLSVRDWMADDSRSGVKQGRALFLGAWHVHGDHNALMSVWMDVAISETLRGPSRST